MNMNENVIEFLRNEETATCTFCQGRYITRIKELAEKKPDECKITRVNNDGSIVAHVPTTWVKINPTQELSEEEKLARSERMRQLRAEQLCEANETLVEMGKNPF